ncbi:MAG TPA: class I SAM-dependent methyltransferase [Terriglobia bacterium]|nr:class I SAM-dependent methyltransferase [Terriglobia bacterium]
MYFNGMDPVDNWLAALEARHMRELRFQDVRRAVQALSSLYVERRDRLGAGSVFDGAGKRAAFALYFSPLRFLLTREIIRALGVAAAASARILDLGCGTGAAGVAWAIEAAGAGLRPGPLRGFDIHPWAVQEARWTYRTLGLDGTAQCADIERVAIPAGAAVIAAFTINELTDAARNRIRSVLLDAAKRGSSALLIEPIARRPTPWWDEWAELWIAAGGREDAWRFPVELPEWLARMDKASGLNHRQLTARTLWIDGGPNPTKLY